MSARTFLLPAALAMVLGGCAAPIPIYSSVDASKTAQVNMKILNGGWICAGQKQYQLKANADGYAPIPAGDRITLGRYFSTQSGNMVYSCNAALSFVPRPGGVYYANFEIVAEACRVEIYQEGAKTRVGLALEPSLGPPRYCGKA